MAASGIYVEDELATVEATLKSRLNPGEEFNFLGIATTQQSLVEVYLLAFLLFALVVGLGGFLLTMVGTRGLQMVTLVVSLLLALFVVWTFLGVTLKNFYIGRTGERLMIYEKPALFKSEKMQIIANDQINSIQVDYKDKTPHIEIKVSGTGPILLDMDWLSYADMRDPTSRLARLSTVGQLSLDLGQQDAAENDDDDIMEAELIE